MRKQKGFTLIELLIVVAIIGIIAAIAIPNLLDAIERSRQKKSTSEVKSIALALQSFSTDYGGYPDNTHNGVIDVAGAAGLAAVWVDVDGSNVFVPDYMQALPVGDGWKTAYTYDAAAPVAGAIVHAQLGEVVSNHFCIGSLGNDRAPSVGVEPATTPCSTYLAQVGTWAVTPPAIAANANAGSNTELHCYSTDIVWGDSSFLQAPEGKQKNC